MTKEDIELWVCEYVVNDETRFRVGLFREEEEPEAISPEERQMAKELVSELDRDPDAGEIASHVSMALEKANLTGLRDLTSLMIARDLASTFKAIRDFEKRR